MKYLLVLAGACLCLAQQLAAQPAAASADEDEDQQLSAALAEAGSSPMDFVRALERHLDKFPKSPRRSEVERALVKAAIENHDERRTILYGERVLARDSDDLQILERVARALLNSDSKDTAERALKYARHYEDLVATMRGQSPPGRVGQGQWQQELDRGTARGQFLEARAHGRLGHLAKAVELARSSYEAFPAAESAREAALWLEKSGQIDEAVRFLADAFTIPDPKVTEVERAADRGRMGDLYRGLKGSEKGLGDLILEAYDRTSALIATRRLQAKSADPNSQATKILDFTLSGLDGNKLAMQSLLGKTLVLDFWATWCGPCRAQHPLYEKVKERFLKQQDVVFLSVNTDEDRELVKPFLEEHQWNPRVYFEDGLSRLLRINSIPTTILVDKRGEVVSRMNGYVPERFVEMLSERIEDALKN